MDNGFLKQYEVKHQLGEKIVFDIYLPTPISKIVGSGAWKTFMRFMKNGCILLVRGNHVLWFQQDSAGELMTFHAEKSQKSLTQDGRRITGLPDFTI